MTPPRRILVLDFDGTVCLGDGPVLAYAELLDEALAGTRRGTGVARALRWFLGDGGVEPGDALAAAVDGSADGYAAAERAARTLGATDADLGAAYAASRDALASGSIPTWAPPGLADLLSSLPDDVEVALVTNAPETGVREQLVHLGLDGVIRRVVASAGKPAGMGTILEGLRSEQEPRADPERLLSVGDIWRNDLEPAFAQGSVTALIERFPAPAGATPAFRAPTIEELYPAIAAWAGVTRKA
jgi:FMN phosphatase YigB (HAD superfamily)